MKYMCMTPMLLIRCKGLVSAIQVAERAAAQAKAARSELASERGAAGSATAAAYERGRSEAKEAVQQAQVRPQHSWLGLCAACTPSFEAPGALHSKATRALQRASCNACQQNHVRAYWHGDHGPIAV